MRNLVERWVNHWWSSKTRILQMTKCLFSNRKWHNMSVGIIWVHVQIVRGGVLQVDSLFFFDQMTWKELVMSFQFKHFAVKHKHYSDFCWLFLLSSEYPIVNFHDLGVELTEIFQDTQYFFIIRLLHFDFCPKQFHFVHSFDNKLLQLIGDFLTVKKFDAEFVGFGCVCHHGDFFLLDNRIL